MKRLVIPLLAAWAGLELHPVRAALSVPDASEGSVSAPAAPVPPAVADSPLVWTGQRLTPPADGSALRADIAMTDEVALIGDLSQVHVYRKETGQWVEHQTLVSSQPADPEFRLYFGSAIAVRGSRAVIGESFRSNGPNFAPPDPAQGDASGVSPAAYVFEDRDGVWLETARLTPDDGAPGAYGPTTATFATSVAVDGGTVAVGAFAYQPDPGHAQQGAVYLFEDDGSGWRQTQKLVADDGRAGDEFGNAIALQGDTLLIGARRATRNRDAPYHGLVYVFERREGVWKQTQKLFPTQMSERIEFGYSLALDGDSAIVGAPREISGDSLPGVVHMLQRSNGLWRVAQALPSLAGTGYFDALGTSVALSGDLAIAGGPQTFYTGGLVQQGVAQVYERRDGAWARRGRLTSPESLDYGFFGNWIALSGRSAIVGSFSAGGDVFALEAHRPPSARLGPSPIHLSLPAGHAGQAMLEIGNSGDQTLQFELNAPARGHEVPLQPRSRPATGDGGAGSSEVTRAALEFALDDGGYEVAMPFSYQYTEQAAIWLNRFAAPAGTGAFTIDGISVLFPTENAGMLLGRPITLVAYYDADADGDPGNAVRLGADRPATVTSEGQFLSFPTDFRVPGDGDVYVGFETTYARGGIAERFPIALDTSAPVFGHSWLASMGDGAPDLDDLSANHVQMFVEDYSTYAARGGNALIRATGSKPDNDCIAPAGAPWLTLDVAEGSVPAGGSASITLALDTAGLAEGTHAAQLCVASNDPARSMQRVPVVLTVLPDGTIFRDGFEGTP